MTEHPDLSPKYDAAIQVRVCGRDVSGRHFDEISTAFPSSRGVMLETVHQLQEGSTLEIAHMPTNRKEIAKVRSLGPKLGASTLVFLEGKGVETFWVKDSLEEPVHRIEGNGRDMNPFVSTNSGTLLAVPERALMQVSRIRIPNLGRLTNALNELVESSLEANLRPTIEQLANAIPEQVVKAQKSVFANFEEQMQVALASFGSRLDARGQEISTRNENVLIQKVLQMMEEVERFVKSRQNEFTENLEGTLLAARERSTQQVESVISDATGKLRELIQEQLQQQAAEAVGHFRSELQNMFQQDLTRYAAELQEQLASNADALRQQFMAQIHNELNEKQEALVRRARRSMNDLAGQNQKRTAALLRELADAMENQPELLPENADA
ncbi:MAG: hypothetical protein HYX72_05235 [Acidobacteria bacterium]|nr:hypothetical protein [Acidobacteriota bacterium]